MKEKVKNNNNKKKIEGCRCSWQSVLSQTQKVRQTIEKRANRGTTAAGNSPSISIPIPIPSRLIVKHVLVFVVVFAAASTTAVVGLPVLVHVVCHREAIPSAFINIAEGGGVNIINKAP